MFSGVPSCTISPSFMIATRCPSLRASSRSWVTKTTVRCTSPWISKNRFCMSRFIRGSRAEKGSSMSRICCLVARARSEERRVGKECRSRCDWSSDVCSSDLALDLQEQVLHVPLYKGVKSRKGFIHEQDLLLGGQGEIGRASCRERV